MRNTIAMLTSSQLRPFKELAFIAEVSNLTLCMRGWCAAARSTAQR